MCTVWVARPGWARLAAPTCSSFPQRRPLHSNLSAVKLSNQPSGSAVTSARWQLHCADQQRAGMCTAWAAQPGWARLAAPAYP